MRKLPSPAEVNRVTSLPFASRTATVLDTGLGGHTAPGAEIGHWGSASVIPSTPDPVVDAPSACPQDESPAHIASAAQTRRAVNGQVRPRPCIMLKPRFYSETAREAEVALPGLRAVNACHLVLPRSPDATQRLETMGPQTNPRPQ